MSDGLRDEHAQLGMLIREVAYAFAQLARTGSPEQLASAREVLVSARRELYTILADGEDAVGLWAALLLTAWQERWKVSAC